MPLERQLVLIVQSGVLSLRVCTCVCAHSNGGGMEMVS